MKNQKEIMVSKLILTNSTKQMNISLKSDRLGNINREGNGRFSLKIPYLKKLLLGKKKVKYVLPQGGVPIVAGPDVINRITAMARAKKAYTFSI